MRTLEEELRALYPLDWQPSSMRPYGFDVFIAAWAAERHFVQGARVGAVLVVRVEAPPIRHYLVCSSDSRGAELVTSGPDLAAELQRAAQMDAGIRAGLVVPPKQDPARMRAVLERCVKALQGVQWAATELDKYEQAQGEECPSCTGSSRHFDDCELAACIRDGSELLKGENKSC